MDLTAKNAKEHARSASVKAKSLMHLFATFAKKTLLTLR